MSLLGQSLPIHSAPVLNDVRYASNSGQTQARLECPLCATSGLMHRSKKALFDHLVGLRKQRWGDREAERLGGLEVDHQFVLGRHLHWKVGGLLALEDAIDVAGRTPVLVDKISAIGDQ